MKAGKSPGAPLVRLAKDQAGVLTMAQLRKHERSAKIRRRWASGWARLAPGYYCTAEPTWHSWCWAGVRRGGTTGVVGGAAAAYLHGFVTTPPARITIFHGAGKPLAAMGGDGVSVELRQGSRAGRGTPPRTSVEVTILDLAGECDENATIMAATRAIAEGMTTPSRIVAELAKRRAVRHRAVLERVCDEASKGVESVLEWRFLELVLLAHGLPLPTRQVSVVENTRTDNVWEEFVLAAPRSSTSGSGPDIGRTSTSRVSGDGVQAAVWPPLSSVRWGGRPDEEARVRTVEEHLVAVLALADPLPPVRLPVRADAATVLAADVDARYPVPPFDNSAMDGFAVRSDDVAHVPCVLEVVGDVPAGSASEVTLAPGQAIRIMTGSPIPDGADAVVPVEDTDQESGDHPLPERVEVRTAVAAGRHVRRRGEDIDVGARVLAAGSVATPAAAAAASSVGLGEWLVHPRPRVLVVATGTELVAPGRPLGPGQIPDSNGLLLSGLVEQFGGSVASVLRVGDDQRAFRDSLAGAGPVDLVVTSGGVSAGAFEVVRQVTSGSVEFVKVSMQPGKPQGLGHWDVDGRPVPLLALPGNPVSVFVSAWLFVRPLVARLAGRPVDLPVRSLPAADGWTAPPGRRQYVPVVVTPEGVRRAHALGSGSHAIASLHLAPALAVVPAEVAQVRPGDVLEVIDTNA